MQLCIPTKTMVPLHQPLLQPKGCFPPARELYGLQVNVLMLASRKEWDADGVGFGSGPPTRGTRPPF